MSKKLTKMIMACKVIVLKDKKQATHRKVRGTLFKPGQGKSK